MGLPVKKRLAKCHAKTIVIVAFYCMFNARSLIFNARSLIFNEKSLILIQNHIPDRPGC